MKSNRPFFKLWGVGQLRPYSFKIFCIIVDLPQLAGPNKSGLAPELNNLKSEKDGKKKRYIYKKKDLFHYLKKRLHSEFNSNDIISYYILLTF